MLGKSIPWKNKPYRDWVKSLDCVLGGSAEDFHHIIGHGMTGMATKPSDLFTMPMARFRHRILHDSFIRWEMNFGSQWVFVIQTINRALDEGILTREFVVEEIKAQVKNTEDLEMLLNEFEE